MAINSPFTEASSRGAIEGAEAFWRAFRAREEDVPREEIEQSAVATWEANWAALWSADSARTGTMDEYVLLYRSVWEEMLARYKKRIQRPRLPPLADRESREEHIAKYYATHESQRPPPIDVGNTLDELRAYFDAPDLDLPDGMDYVWLHRVRHVLTGEECHLLIASDGSSGAPPPLYSQPILTCKSLTPGSTLVPSAKQGEWASAQMWLPSGYSRLFSVER